MRPVRRVWIPVLLGLASCAVALAACAAQPGPAGPGSSESRTTASPTSSGSPGEPTAELEVVVVRGPGEPEQRWTLRCAGPAPLPGSTHPWAGEACRLVAARPELLTPPPGNQLCTQQYGGPQVAAVTGTAGSARVERRFDRTDGCGITAWKAAEALLGPPGGAI
ncbi:serine protease inhibitor [Sinomonas atrocyanea]|uniref:serine protease inhibitor n=1 Tax=Sinomonas atrocyanea TaxID=37927 RepID=UPI003D993C1B